MRRSDAVDAAERRGPTKHEADELCLIADACFVQRLFHVPTDCARRYRENGGDIPDGLSASEQTRHAGFGGSESKEAGEPLGRLDGVAFGITNEDGDAGRCFLRHVGPRWQRTRRYYHHTQGRVVRRPA